MIDSSYSARGDNIDSYIGTSPDENIFQRKYSLSNNGQVLRIHNVGMTRKFIWFIKYDWVLAKSFTWKHPFQLGNMLVVGPGSEVKGGVSKSKIVFPSYVSKWCIIRFSGDDILKN